MRKVLVQNMSLELLLSQGLKYSLTSMIADSEVIWYLWMRAKSSQSDITSEIGNWKLKYAVLTGQSYGE